MDDAASQQHLLEQHPQRSTGSLLFWLPTFLFLYLLGIGPAAWVHLKYPPSRPVIEALYAPVVFACDRSPAIANAVLWYLATIWRIPIP